MEGLTVEQCLDGIDCYEVACNHLFILNNMKNVLRNLQILLLVDH